jgi:hypothetical protein
MSTQVQHLDASAQCAIYREEIQKLDGGAAIACAEDLGFDIEHLCRGVRNYRPDGSNRKMDANEAAFLARALLYMKAQSVDVKYASAEFRNIFNVNTEVPLGAASVSTPQFDSLGEFKRIANTAQDLPAIDATQTETLNKFYPYGATMAYSLYDLARAAFSGVPLETKKMQFARRAWEMLLDGIAAVGDSDAGIYGITNHPNIITVTTNNAGTWSAKIAANNQSYVLDDLNKLAKAPVTTTKGIVRPETVCMGIDHYALISSTPLNTANPNDHTILSQFLKTNPWIKKVVPWARLDLADAELDGPRVMALSTEKDVCEFYVNELALLPPEQRGMNTVVTMHGRTAGLVAMQPKGIAYMDAV